MSRHRNVRSMNYTDEYDGYDDVYGHSVEDDYCVSPSEAAFMYDREGQKAKQKIGAFFERDNDIAEENEEVDSKEANLSDIDRARLETCIEHVKKNLSTTIPKQDLIDIILVYNFNADKVVKFLSDGPEYKDNKHEKGLKLPLKTKTSFAIPKLNTKFTSLPGFAISKTENYTSLADLTSHHLNKVGLKTDLFEKKVDAVTETVAYIDLEDDCTPKPVKSLNALEKRNGLNTNWHIDLTKALRITKSAPQIRIQQSQQEQFIPQFVDCEPNLTSLRTNRDHCCMDISWILKVKLRYLRKPSRFAKILCARPKMHTPCIEFDDDVTSNIVAFKFDTPSPDDFISQHLLRK